MTTTRHGRRARNKRHKRRAANRKQLTTGSIEDFQRRLWNWIASALGVPKRMLGTDTYRTATEVGFPVNWAPEGMTRTKPKPKRKPRKKGGGG